MNPYGFEALDKKRMDQVCIARDTHTIYSTYNADGRRCDRIYKINNLIVAPVSANAVGYPDISIIISAC